MKFVPYLFKVKDRQAKRCLMSPFAGSALGSQLNVDTKVLNGDFFFLNDKLLRQSPPSKLTIVLFNLDRDKWRSLR